ISTYDSVNLGEIYDGIELKLRAYGNNVEKLFCVKPGADPEQIKIRLSGVKDYGVQNAEITHPLVPSREGINPKSDASTSLSMTSLRVESRNQNQKLQINKSGELEVETGLGTVKFTKPVAYQEIDGRRVEVEVEYSIQGTGIGDQEAGGKRREVVAEGLTTDNCSPTYGFTVASYDRTKDLIIDPLLASTFLGGSDNDYGRSLALDASGNVYVTGDTESLDFPTTGGVSDTSYNSVKDVFISKFDSGLSSLLVSTYLGGSDSDNVYCLYIDNNGNIYLTGSTASTDFPTTAGAYSISISDSNNVDAFISKLDSGLTTLIASTFLGGTKEDVAQSLIVDASGYVYAGGYTLSSNFPTTPGAYDTYNSSFYSQTFISKLNNGLNSLLASTFFGGGRNDYICSIVTDTSGSAYVSGQTYSTDFPTHTGSYDTSFNGDSSDAFVSKFNSMLTNLIASTFLGGYNEEKIQSMYLDSSGDVYITGWTYSSDFPTTPAAYDSLYNGSSEAFVSKLSGTLKNLLASTYLGGADDDSGYALVLDIEGNIYVTGLTSSSTFPITIGAYTTSFNGGSNDAFVSKLNGSLTAMLASTYLGGSSDDYINSVGIDSNENIYVAGITSSSNIPTTTNAYDTSYTGGGLDAFISKFDSNLSATTPSPSPAPTQIPTIITPEPTPTTTCTDTYESNDSFSTSYGPLTSEDSYSGKICDATDEDYFNITVESAGTISLSLVVPSNRDYDLYLHNPSQQLIAYSEEPAGETEIIESDVSETGIYYIKVNGFENDYDENQVYTLSGTWPSFIIPTPIPTDTKTPTPTSTPSPVSCDVATAITSSPSTVTVTKGNSTTVTVTVTGANGCAVTNDRVKATSNNTSIATVSPSKATTDANGQAVFTINGLKKGSAKVTFKETLSKLKVKVPVTVTK
ncbi:MAG TPA: SBBP repeat-containing protein, partial [Candidatus Wujingus californicus]|uniref:SBBP repeat-containing protein n=1 Tax=Candidatus Wujingus californicus TaxID=3367618 RepID=UPI002712AE0C|nr:SBBP repeat-containing protein [Candidatus Brocadiales bacterium]